MVWESAVTWLQGRKVIRGQSPHIERQSMNNCREMELKPFKPLLKFFTLLNFEFCEPIFSITNKWIGCMETWVDLNKLELMLLPKEELVCCTVVCYHTYKNVHLLSRSVLKGTLTCTRQRTMKHANLNLHLPYVGQMSQSLSFNWFTGENTKAYNKNQMYYKLHITNWIQQNLGDVSASSFFLSNPTI